MSFDWTEFLALAEALQSNPDLPGPQEAAFRSAASRAYYAAFHRALDIARGEGFVSSYQKDDHSAVSSHFREHRPSDQIRRKIALNLERLRDHRRKADYDDTLDKQASSLAYQAIVMAKSVLENLNSLTQN